MRSCLTTNCTLRMARTLRSNPSVYLLASARTTASTWRRLPTNFIVRHIHQGLLRRNNSNSNTASTTQQGRILTLQLPWHRKPLSRKLSRIPRNVKASSPVELSILRDLPTPSSLRRQATTETRFQSRPSVVQAAKSRHQRVRRRHLSPCCF